MSHARLSLFVAVHCMLAALGSVVVFALLDFLCCIILMAAHCLEC